MNHIMNDQSPLSAHLFTIALTLYLALIPGCGRFFFYPERELRQNPALAAFNPQDVYFTTSDGLRLHAWIIRAKENKGTILVLHGNAENLSTHINSVLWLVPNGYNIFMFDYRGFGRSEGSPNIPGLQLDAEAAIDTLFHMEDINQPKAATLVFPAAHNNSPASMFGHTLIRIDSRPRSDLLSHAATYAAVADDRNNFLYAFKGIFGFYRGYYSNLPYYAKVAEYNDIERRDIWEYELNLTEDEVYRMVLYIWELQDIYSDYYFFDENCSYNLLFLLEAARPSLRLTDEVGNGLRFWVIPVDTVRAIKKYGLVKAVRYRPSKVTRILFMASRMYADLQDVALALSSGHMEPQALADTGLDAGKQAKVLDLAAEVLQYEFSIGRIEKDVYLKRYLAVLKARSSLGSYDSDTSEIPPPTPPDEGHLPGRIGIGAGYSDHSAFAEISWQPAYHDLMDPDPGYVRGSQIKFMDIRVRHYIDDSSLKLQGINVIDIVSLSDRSKFYKPVSWKVNTGLERMILADGRDHLLYRLNFGRGISIAAGRSGLAYAMAEADMKYTGAFESRYAAGIGSSLGLLMNLTASWKLHLSAQKVFHMLGDDHRYTRFILDQSLAISTNNSLRLSVLWEEGFNHSRSEQQLSLQFFF